MQFVRKCRLLSFRCLQHSVLLLSILICRFYRQRTNAEFFQEESVLRSTLRTAGYCRLYGAYFAVIIISTSTTQFCQLRLFFACNVLTCYVSTLYTSFAIYVFVVPSSRFFALSILCIIILLIPLTVTVHVGFRALFI